MEEVAFELWWEGFLRQEEAARDPYAAVRGLLRYVDGLPIERRRAFQCELVRVVADGSVGWGLAVEALVNVEADILDPLRFALQTEPGASVTDQSAPVLRALARSKDRMLCDLVESFLLSSPTALYWSSVPWALWPHSRPSFARLWARYFQEAPPDSWRSTAIVQAFLQEDEALRLVRDALRSQNPGSWTILRDAVLAELASPWLSDEDRGRLERICWEAG
jgi:hypothetical protein